MSKIITIIPARLAATRFPNKPLLNINGKTLIQRVYENCKKYLPGDIVVAAGDKEIIDECNKFGAKAILTDPSLPSGTDRIVAALDQIDPTGKEYDIVVNFQGDGINIDPRVNLPLIEMVERTGCDMATCGMVMQSKEEIDNPNNVKIVMGLRDGKDEGRCLYFTRAVAPYTRDVEKCKSNDYYWHLGIYAFKAESLRKFVSFPIGVLEDREKLEQLRMLENGLSIYAKIVGDVRLVKDCPPDINTPDEYAEALKWIKD